MHKAKMCYQVCDSMPDFLCQVAVPKWSHTLFKVNTGEAPSKCIKSRMCLHHFKILKR